MKEVYENFSGALERAKRETALSRAMFFEDVETMKSYTLGEILEVEDKIEAIDRMEENRVNDEL
jgi:hypothetical protein